MSKPAILLTLVVSLLAGCGRPSAADSSSPAYPTAAARVAWMRKHIHGDEPSAMRDAHFLERDIARAASHQGPAYTTRFFSGKIVIAPADASKWAAATRTGFKPPANPLASAPAAWAMTQAEYDAASWYDPAPIFGRTSGGYMAITADGAAVFVYQVDR